MKKVMKKDLETKLVRTAKEKTCTFYCRGIKITNKNFAHEESKRLGFRTIGSYIDAMLDCRKNA